MNTHRSTLDIWLEIALAVLSIIGMALLSGHINKPGFCVLLMGNLSGLTLFIRMKMKWMVLSQMFFIVININGIFQFV